MARTAADSTDTANTASGVGGTDSAGNPDGTGTGDADPVEVARTIALRQLEVRDRSRHELADSLRRRGVPDDAAGTVLDALSRVGLVDDARFADMWVDSRRRTRGLSRRALALELAQKGIGADDAAAALDGIDDESDQALADRFATRRAAGLAGLPQDVALRRLAGQLARKGYGAGTSFRAAAAALAPTQDRHDVPPDGGRPPRPSRSLDTPTVSATRSAQRVR